MKKKTAVEASRRKPQKGEIFPPGTLMFDATANETGIVADGFIEPSTKRVLYIIAMADGTLSPQWDNEVFVFGNGGIPLVRNLEGRDTLAAARAAYDNASRRI